MKKTKGLRLVSTLVALMFLVSAVLTGCGKTATDTGTATQSSSSTPSATDSTAQEKPKLDPYEIVWYYNGNGAQADVETVQNEMNKITVPEINATVKLQALDWGSYDQKLQMVIGAGEKFDLCWTSSWSNNWLTNINKGAYVELTDELLTKDAPTIKANMPELAWDALKVNGKLYTLFNPQIYANGIGLSARKDLADKYQFDPHTITKLDELTPYFEKIKAGENGTYGLTLGVGASLGALQNVLGYEEVTGRDIPGVVVAGDSSLKVVNQYDLDAVKNTFKTYRDWYLKGYTRKDAATYGGDDAKDGKAAIRIAGAYKPGVEADEKNWFGGRDAIVAPFGPAIITSGSFMGTMTAVSNSSKDADRALMYLDMVWKDKKLFNLIVHGVEGKHYTKNADGFVTMTAGSGYDYSGAGWFFGPQFNEDVLLGQSKTVWDDTKKINDAGVKSALFGFVFDPTNVKSELAKVDAIKTQYIKMLVYGASDPEKTLPTFVEKMKSAGSDKIIAEAQAQIDKWKASK